MVRSRCPECGQVIGGQDHRLERTNHVSSEFEELSRRDGNVRLGYWVNNPY
jgi:hypothetical protein